VSAQLLADFRAGKPVPVLAFLEEGVRAIEADRARGASRRKPAVVSASPDGSVRVAFLGFLASALRALEAGELRAASRRIKPDKRDADARAVTDALREIWTLRAPDAPKLPFKPLVKILSGYTGVGEKRVRDVLRELKDVRLPLVWADSAYGEGGLLSCEGCATVDDVCLLHGSAAAIFNAALPPRPEQIKRHKPRDPESSRRVGMLPKAASAGVVGIGPLQQHRI
jgi:hypothetical protein